MSISPADRNLGIAAIALLLPILVYWSTTKVMIGLWSMDAYRHCYIIPVVAFLLLWRERREFASARPTGSWWGVGAIAVLVVTWLVGEATSVQLVEQLALVSMVSALAFSILGWREYKRMWFPLAYLLFAVPIGASVVPYLMDVTASLAVAGLQTIHVPALREGMVVALPGGTFEVVEACSGYNYLNAGLALGVLVAHLMFRTFWKQLCYVGAVVAVFIVVNGVRAFIVMLVASESHMRFFAGSDHVLFGWVLFLVAMLAMYWVAEKYSDVRSAGTNHAPG